MVVAFCISTKRVLLEEYPIEYFNFFERSEVIIELKPSGKRLMRGTDFINGMKTEEIEL